MARTALVAGFAGAMAAAFAAGWAVHGATEPSPDSSPVLLPRARQPDAVRQSDPPTPSDGSTSPETGAAGARRAARVKPSDRPPTTDLRGEIAREFGAKYPKLPAPAPEELDALTRRAADEVEGFRRAYEAAPKSRIDAMAKLLADRAALRDRIGTLAGEAEIVLQVRGSRASVNAEGSSERGATAAAPLDLATEPGRASKEPDQSYFKGGVIPYGSIFVVDRAEVTIALGDYDAPACDARMWYGPLLAARGGPRRLHAVFVGASRVGAGEQGRVVLTADGAYAAAEMRLHGRVVAEADAPPDKSLVWQEDGAQGYLHDGASVRLQVRAGHGGGNPNTVDLGGSRNGFINGVSATPVWDDAAKPDKIGSSLAWRDGAGLVPPGFVFRVQRIDWRTRLHEGDQNSRFELQVGPWTGSRTVARNGKDVSADAGMWTGNFVVHPGEESQVALTCAYYGFAEAVVYGRLERP